MKKLIVIFLTAVLLLSMAACRTDNPEPTMKDPDEWSVRTSQSHSDYEGIEVQIANAAWGENGFVLEVDWINRTPHEALFGASYSIERKEGDRWVNCQAVDELAFIAIAYILPAGDTRTESYQVSALFDVSEAGTYRFRSEISVNDGTENANKCIVWAVFTLESDQDKSQINTEKAVEYGAQYVRTDGYQDGARFPKVKIIRSTEELNSYYEANKDTFNLERKEKVYSDTTVGFLGACDKYDGAYFEKGYLVLVLLEEGSGSIHHEVTGSTISSDGDLGIYIKRIVPEFGTCDMAEWHIILEMAKSVEIKDENSVRIFLSACAASGEDHVHQTASEPQTVADPISGYCGNTQTTVYIDGEAYTFMYDHSVTLTDILINLAYDPNKICRCRPEYTVDTEFGKGYGINLTAGYARCEKGQADLTKEQIEQIRTIIEWVKTEKPGK